MSTVFDLINKSLRENPEHWREWQNKDHRFPYEKEIDMIRTERLVSEWKEKKISAIYRWPQNQFVSRSDGSTETITREQVQGLLDEVIPDHGGSFGSWRQDV